MAPTVTSRTRCSSKNKEEIMDKILSAKKREQMKKAKKHVKTVRKNKDKMLKEEWKKTR